MAKNETMTKDSAQSESLIEFPCEFPIKIIGHEDKQLLTTVCQIVCRHVPGFTEDGMSVRASRNGNYLSISCLVQVESKSQLDQLYQELSGHALIKFVL